MFFTIFKNRVLYEQKHEGCFYKLEFSDRLSLSEGNNPDALKVIFLNICNMEQNQ